MIRTMVQLTENQSERLKSVAAKRGVSVAELIRQSVDDLLRGSGERSTEEVMRRALAAAGKHRSGKTNVAERHDQYLSEDYSR